MLGESLDIFSTEYGSVHDQEVDLDDKDISKLMRDLRMTEDTNIDYDSESDLLKIISRITSTVILVPKCFGKDSYATSKGQGNLLQGRL